MAIQHQELGRSPTPQPPMYSRHYQDHPSNSFNFERIGPEQSSLSEFPFDCTSRTLPPQSLLARRYSHWGVSTTDSPNTKVFTYDLQRKGRTWAELRVAADESMSKTMPTFLEGSRIEGQVSLWAARGEAINSVVVSIRGQVITGSRASEHWSFFEVSQKVWSRSMGDPRKGLSLVDLETDSSLYADKLRGTLSWPFSLEIPREILVPPSAMTGCHGTYSLPESFSERHMRACIRYEICVTFVRGHFRPNDRIRVAFGYVPLTVPSPPSPLRRLAYEQGTPLLGPMADPAGWHECRPIELKGCVRGLRKVKVYCTLYLAKPLSYTRGTVIPCWLRLRSQDPEALDILATPKAITARLQRRVKTTVNGSGVNKSHNRGDQTELSELGIWWPERVSANTRDMSGELHLSIDMKPSSAMAHFRIEYSFMLFPFDALAFDTGVSTPLIEEAVEIMTGYAPGKRPEMYAPPEYESPDSNMCDPGFIQY